MGKHVTYLDSLRNDMLEQFKGKPNTEVYLKAVVRQFDELYEFFCQLNTLRWLNNAEGVQLDGIGDIVCMSRTDALVISKLAEQNVPMDDETYREYLAWKMSLNNTNCTYKDVYCSLKKFWPYTPLYYSEDPERPATIIFSTPLLSSYEDVNILFLAPKVKAAGVALEIIADYGAEGRCATYTGAAAAGVAIEINVEVNAYGLA